MKCLSVRLPAVLLGLIVLGAGSVRAGVIDYSWSIMPTDVTVGNSEVTITPAADGSLAVNDMQPHLLPIGTLNMSSTTTGTPDSFNTNITMKGTFIDHDSGASATLTFVDNLSGTLSSSSVGTLTLNNTFPVSPTQTLSIGGNTYTVSLSPSTETLPPTAGFPAVHLNTIVTSQVPEPGTLVLSSTAAALVSLFVRRRRRLV
jgi:hypothetical protein